MSLYEKVFVERQKYMAGYPYLETVVYHNFYEMLKGVYDKTPDEIALRFREKEEIIDISYTRLVEEVGSVYGFLKNKKMQGRIIGIVSENRYEYIPLYLGTSFENVIAPIDKESVPEDFGKQIRDFDVEMIFYTEKTRHLVEQFEYDDKIVCINIDDDYKEITTKKPVISDFFEQVKDVDSDKLSVLAFTSGTTGALKGAMLSQRNVTATLRGALQNNVLKSPSLAVLPMNHTYGFNPGILCTLYNGGTLCLTMNIKHFQRDLKEYNPYFVSLVPMVVEGMYNKIWAEAKRMGKDKLLRRMIKLSNFLLKFKIDIRKKAFGNLLNPELNFISFCGAHLNPAYVDRYRELGIYLLNGYGLTECAPLVCINREFDMDVNSVGTVTKEVDAKIAEDGEILIKGPNVMLGYYKNPEATKETMTDGYFKTGDYGYLVERRLYVTGRKKNLIILDNGKNVSPEVLEAKLNALDWVKECLVIVGKVQNRRVLKALIYSEESPSEERIRKDIEAINGSVPEYMQILDYKMMDTEFEKNSTKKILRNRYEEN